MVHIRTVYSYKERFICPEAPRGVTGISPVWFEEGCFRETEHGSYKANVGLIRPDAKRSSSYGHTADECYRVG